MMRNVHLCVTVDYQQIENGNRANQIHGFTIDYGTFILKGVRLANIEAHAGGISLKFHLKRLPVQ